MTIRDFQEANRIRNERFPGTSKEWSVLEWAGAMCGEAGEAANFAKKIRRGLAVDVAQDLRSALARELADVVSYCALIATHQNIDLQDACREKFNEVAAKHGMPDRV